RAARGMWGCATPGTGSIATRTAFPGPGRGGGGRPPRWPSPTPTGVPPRPRGGGGRAASGRNGPAGASGPPPGGARATWGYPTIFRRPLLFDPRTGRALLRLRVERRDRPGGGFVIEVSGDSEGIATYDAAGRWVAHALTGDDGSAVTYERIG